MLFEKCTFSQIGLWDVVWWQSPPQLASSAYSIPNPNVTLSTEFYVLQWQKVWGLNEHGETFEMANPLCLSFWVKHKLFWEWSYSFPCLYFKLARFDWAWSFELRFLSYQKEEERVGTWEYRDGQIHPLCAPADFGAKPRLTTGRIFFPALPLSEAVTALDHVAGVPPRWRAFHPRVTLPLAPAIHAALVSWNPSIPGSLCCSPCCNVLAVELGTCWTRHHECFH